MAKNYLFLSLCTLILFCFIGKACFSAALHSNQGVDKQNIEKNINDTDKKELKEEVFQISTELFLKHMISFTHCKELTKSALQIGMPSPYLKLLDQPPKY